MAGGIFALLDDVAALARIAAASVDDVSAAAGRASAKAAGVVVDDTAVTPQYLHGSAADRELPIIKRIAKGSLRNKLLFILPVALLLSEFLPEGLPILLIIGGTYLSYEGAEKVWERVSHHHAATEDLPDEQGEFTPEHEERTVAGAIRTDFILSAEIMVIALNEVVGSDPDAGFVTRAIILTVVAVLITVLVYGVVALIVKMDDIGLRLAERASATVAMLWVGGHILLASSDELGLHAPYDVVHHWEEAVHDAVGALGGVLAWLVNTAASAVVGLVVGAIAVAVMHVLPFGKHEDADGREPAAH
jgi:predicted DNA repair protein MutK